MASSILPFEKEVLELLGRIESQHSQHNIRFIFVVATGSRLQRTDHSNSNLNIKGFYVGNRASYLSVVRPPKEIKIVKDSKKDSVIDYEFSDIKMYLNVTSQPDKRSNDRSMWIRSDLVYVNQIESILFKEISDSCSFPLAVHAGRLVQYSKTFPKTTSLRVADVYFALSQAILAYDNILHEKDKSYFPDNNAWKVIEYISSSFPESEAKTAQQIGRLFKKYISLKEEKVEEAEKQEDEDSFIQLLVQIVENNKPLSKREMEVAIKSFLPQIPLPRANMIFQEIFLEHPKYKSFEKHETIL